MNSKRIPQKEISPSDVSELLSLKDTDVNAKLLKNYFACFYGDKEARFQPNDYFMLERGKFYNSERIKTTVGRYLYNMFALPVPYLKKYGYMNDPLTVDRIEQLEKVLGDMILEDELTTKEYAQYMDRSEWISMNCVYYIAPSINNAIVLPKKDILKKRDELFDQYKDDIKKGDLNVANKIEKELMDVAKKDLATDDDPSYDNYKSGNFKFAKSYKKSAIMIGAVKDVNTSQLQILKSNYADGVDKNEYDKTAMLTVIGGYSRGVATEDYGYETKKYNNALQNVVVDFDQLDCGTDKYLNITINPKLKSMFLYRFVIDGSKIVELTEKNIDNYVGKPIKLRSPMFCKGDKLCMHCAGTLFKRIDITDAGLVCSNLTGNLMNLSMKKMHDSSVTIVKLNLDDFITEK